MTERFTYAKPKIAFSKGGINDNVTGETYEFTMDTVLDLLNNLYEEKMIIKSKLLNEILEYDKVGKDNYDFGFSESLDYIHEEVEELFENPIGFTLEG